MKRFWIAAGIVVVIELLIIGAFWYLSRGEDFNLVNPLAKKKVTGVIIKRERIVGFLPTWMLGKTKIYTDEITDLVFSGVEVQVDGSLLWDVQSKKIDSDNYLNLKQSISKAGGKNYLSIKLFDDNNLEKLVVDPEARLTLITEVKNIVEAGKFDGVNVDFEYMSNPTRILDEDFGGLFDQMKQSGWKEVSVDVFANTIIKGDKDRLDKLAKRVDQIIVMAYDFHRPGSDYAGFVAPMTAAPGERSINEILQKVVAFGLEREKVVLAFPLYGYEWVTDDDKIGSAQVTGGYGRTVQYQESVGFTGTTFDEVAQSPWITWTETVNKLRVTSYKVGKKTYKRNVPYTVTEIHQAYFENEQSLAVKLEAVKQAQLAGVGFWALGYEGKGSDLIKNLVTRF